MNLTRAEGAPQRAVVHTDGSSAGQESRPVPVLMHLVSLQQAAGVEAHFAEFIRHARNQDTRYSHGWMDAVGHLHPIVAAQLEGQLASRITTKRRWGLRVPSWPPQLRRWHCRRELERVSAAAVVVWNRTARVAYALDAMGADRCIHWEHGAAWHGGRERERRKYLEQVPIAIANSAAAARVLQLLWGYRGELQVCRNALRPSLVPPAPVAKSRSAGPIVLGVAARLFPVKGVAIVLHTVAALRMRNLDVVLRVAGEGPELARLRALAAGLGVAAYVTFLGALHDMAAFYRSVDCLLHAPLTEAFGLVALEAAAHGCPVIATAIDGLPESVTEGVTGYTLEPTLSVDDYVGLGGGREGLPEHVYSARADALVEPRALAPSLLADAVERVFERAASFETLSARASQHVLAAPDFAAHVRDVLGIIDGFLRERT